MADLVKRAGTVAGAGRRYAQARGIAPESGERAFVRWTTPGGSPPRCGPTLLGLLRAREQDHRSLEDRAAFVELAAARAERGEDLFRGGPAPPRRQLVDVAAELAPGDEDLRWAAVRADRLEAVADQRARAGLEVDDLDEASALRLLEGGAA